MAVQPDRPQDPGSREQSAPIAHASVPAGWGPREHRSGARAASSAWDGRRVWIRELDKGDRAALCFIFRRLSEESRHQRFLGPKHRLSTKELDFLMDVDHWHHEAVVAWSPPPRAPIGIARYVRLEEFDLAEVAVTVVDIWQRRGVGAELVAALRERALRVGIRRFTVTVLTDNKGALALVRRFGPPRTTLRSGAVVEIQGYLR